MTASVGDLRHADPAPKQSRPLTRRRKCPDQGLIGRGRPLTSDDLCFDAAAAGLKRRFEGDQSWRQGTVRGNSVEVCKWHT